MSNQATHTGASLGEGSQSSSGEISQFTRVSVHTILLLLLRFYTYRMQVSKVGLAQKCFSAINLMTTEWIYLQCVNTLFTFLHIHWFCIVILFLYYAVQLSNSTFSIFP